MIYLNALGAYWNEYGISYIYIYDSFLEPSRTAYCFQCKNSILLPISSSKSGSVSQNSAATPVEDG